jgi:hypothetical protein
MSTAETPRSFSLVAHVRRLSKAGSELYIRIGNSDIARLGLRHGQAIDIDLGRVRIAGIVKTSGDSPWLAPASGSSNAAITAALREARLEHGMDVSATVHSSQCGPESNRGSAGYKVPAAGTALGHALRPSSSIAAQRGVVRNRHKPIVIDDAFIGEWHPKYEWTENDEDEYQRLVPTVARDMAATGTISKDTFLAIWNWKGAMRVIGHVVIGEYDTLYAPAFRHSASEPPERKLAALIAPGVKLPGVEAATGSTLIHFMHPDRMPIIDVRTCEVLFAAGLISTDRKDLAHYEEFRRAIDGIKRRCPRWTLRQIDRALFAYHKQVFEKDGSGGCRTA